MADAKSNARMKYIAISIIAVSVVVVACAPKLEHRGYRARAKDLQQLQLGMSKTDVEALLGSPSTKATINRNGDGYYYISSRVESRSILKPKEVERNVLAVRFDGRDNVSGFAQYGLEDGQIIDLNTRKTISGGQEETFLKQFFRNLRDASPITSPFGGQQSSGGPQDSGSPF